MIQSAAEILREYGPFPGADQVHGVTFDGRHVWFASGDKLNAFDPASGKTARSIDVPAHAGTAFDGRHLFQLAEDRIQKIDPETGRVVATIPAPGGGGDSGLAWAEGVLWVGQYRDRKIHQNDPLTGAILHTIESNRFVTTVTWIDGALWHGVWEGDESDLRRVDPRTFRDDLTILSLRCSTRLPKSIRIKTSRVRLTTGASVPSAPTPTRGRTAGEADAEAARA